MRPGLYLLTIFIVSSVVLSACSPSQAELDDQAAQNAVNIHATPTSGVPAPTLKPTSTLVPTATSTPSPTPTQTAPQASTPLLIFTPTISPTSTLGMPAARTPAPPAVCPQPGSEEPTISFAQSPADYEAQILEYLNAKGSGTGLGTILNNLQGTLADEPVGIKSKVFTKDVTGDTVPDVVLDVIHFYPWGNYEGFLFIFTCRNGKYETIYAEGMCCQFIQENEGNEGIRAIQDLNLDRVPEVVYSNITILGTHAYYVRDFRIVEWDGEQFQELIRREIDGPSGVRIMNSASVDTGDGVILDTDGDGTQELALTHAVAVSYPDSGPQRERTDIWAWDGYAFTLARWQYTAPVYRIHAVWDGDDASRFGDYQAALAFYQQAIFDEQLLGWSQGQFWPAESFYDVTPTPDPDERLRLGAYARYRIMLLHAIQGYLPEAEIVYATLLENFPEGASGYPYAEMATVFWDEFNRRADIAVACEKAINYAAAHEEQIVAPLGFSFYNDGYYQPQDICPFE